nr:5-methyltetrahydropteroyltriglutamate--homocysteine methyltransferase-like [Tanacetum cinerariifolium]
MHMLIVLGIVLTKLCFYKISKEEYVKAIKEVFYKVVELQEDLYIDVLVHGKPEIVMDNPNSPNEPNEESLEENPVILEPNHVEDAYDPNEMVNIPDDEDLVDHDGDDEEQEEEPEQQIGHGNQFAQHPNPQPDNMNGWLEKDDDVNENVNNEDIEDEDVEVEVDDVVELIFPYEMEGDQTPPPRDESSDSEPPRDESSDSVSSDSESEDEEADIAPEATTGTVA